MSQYIKENRAGYVGPIYKKYKQDLTPVSEIDNLLSELLATEKISTIYCNSFFAEKTVNVILNYFNEQSRLNNNFKENVLNEIKNIEFAYATDNKKLKANIELNAENSFRVSANGMKNILAAFINYSDFTSNLNNSSFEDINYAIEPINEVYDSVQMWVVQTIDEPWFK